MRTWIIVALVLAPALAVAQPAEPSSASGPNQETLQKECNAALNEADKAGNKIFISDVANVASGTTSATELAKTAAGRGCLNALSGSADYQKTTSETARQDQADQLAATIAAKHEQAAKAIAKNEKHVILAYAAMWLLSAGFVLFLWRRQQALKIEIAQLRRDLEAAAK